MIKKKEEQLRYYFEISVKMMDALEEGMEDKVPTLLEEREVCITAIDKIDREAGVLLMNEQIEIQLKELAALEAKLFQQLQQALRKLSNRVRIEKNDQYLKSQYEDLPTVSKGVFYDKTK
jgi:hypothetical protein